MNDKTKKIIKTIIEWVVYVIIFIVIVRGTPFLLTKVLDTEYPIASITSSSMWPALKEGDIVFIKGADSREDIEIGDIVVFTNKRGFTIHRVEKVNEDTFQTKGDANNVSDEAVEYDMLVGKAVELGDRPIRIPWLGRISMIYNKK